MRIPATFVALTAAAVLAAGCGSDDPAPTGSTAPKVGGNLTAYSSVFPDFLDPALAYSAEGWQALWPAYTGLLTYRHEEGAAGAQVVPGLAEDLPQISADGLTYRLKLRSGLKYSDGSPVKASDFEHEIKRVLNLESGGSFFFQGIEGADAYVEAGKKNADLPGINADDATGDITIKLTAPDGQFTYALATSFAALVPGDTPFENATDAPVPGVGPYKLVDVKPNRAYALTRVDGFVPLPNVKSGSADRIDVSTVSNASRQAQDIIDNKVDAVLGPPSGDQLALVRAGTKGRYREYTTNAISYFFLNTKIAPFDDVKVRQAVATAVDERALARLSGGLLTPTCNFLPPAVSGFKKIEPCPWGDPTKAPDLAKAKQLLEDSGANGEAVSVWASDSPGDQKVAEYFADLLNQLGLDAKPKIISGAVFPQTVGNARTKAQAGVNGWTQDFPGAATFFQLIDGAAIQPRNNLNFGNVDDPFINATLQKANATSDAAKAAPLYEAIDRRLVDQALVLPFGNPRSTKITSERVAFDQAVYHPVYSLDLTTLALDGDR